MMSNLVGKEFGKYRLTLLLERTAFAEIYSAEQINSETVVTFKTLQVELSLEELDLFLNAAQSLLTLVHPHILQVIEVGKANDDRGNSFPFLAITHVSDQTLRHLYPIGSFLPPLAIASYTKQIAEALDYAHQQELVHGDIQPGNIIVGSDNQLLLSDFSVGLLSHSVDTMASTTAYMAPEQIQGYPVPASDQYALAVMVYEWLSGELPFTGSLSEISNHHQFTPPQPLRIKIPAIPPDVEEVVLTALAKKPEERFSNVLDFATALEKALPSEQDLSFVSPPPSLPLQPTEEEQKKLWTAGGSPGWMPGFSDQGQFSDAVGAVLGLQPSPQNARSFMNRFSRRALLIGMPALIVAGSGFATWYFNQKVSLPIEANSSTVLTYRGHVGSVTALAWSPDGTSIASGADDHTIRIWSPQTGTDVYVFRGSSGSIPAVTWASDSKRIASAIAGPSTSGGAPAPGNTVQVWYAFTGELIYSYHGHTSGITNVAWAPRGERIASSSTDYTVQIWDATTGQKPLIYHAYPWYEWTIAWSPDTTWIASGGPDHLIQQWAAATANPAFTYQGHTGAIEAIAWSPDGSKIASGSDDHTVRIWNTFSYQSSLTYHGHTDYVRAVAWSPDGVRIASGSNDKTVQVWNTFTGQNIFTYHGHSNGVTTVVWSPDGKYLASGSEDGTVQVWQPS